MDIAALVIYIHRVPDYNIALMIDYYCFFCLNALVAELQKGNPTYALVAIFGYVNPILFFKC